VIGSVLQFWTVGLGLGWERDGMACQAVGGWSAWLGIPWDYLLCQKDGMEWAGLGLGKDGIWMVPDGWIGWDEIRNWFTIVLMFLNPFLPLRS